MWKILFQLIKEFWIPFSISILLTAHTYYNLPSNSNSDGFDFFQKALVTFFGISFFFSQWNRVKKQLRVENGLTGIERKVENMLDNLDKKTNHMIGHIIGGNSFCYLSVSEPNGRLMLSPKGEYPLYDVTVRVIDLDVFEQNREAVALMITLGTVTPWFPMILLSEHLPLGIGQSRRFNIFFFARNGTFTQLSRHRRVNNEWTWATKIVSHGLPEFAGMEIIDERFPRNADGKVDWD